MVIDGSPAPRQQATYDATVSGKLTKSRSLGSIQSNDTISGSTATGQVWGSKDGYRFTGNITELSVDGKLTIAFEHSDRNSTTSDVLPNTLVVDGSGTPDQMVSYTITVSGVAEKNGELGSINAYDTVKSGKISGRVIGGKDGYRFSGDVTRIEIDGPGVLRFEYTEE